MARMRNGCSKVSSPSTGTSERPPAKAFNDAIMRSYHQYRSLPKEIQDMFAFTQFMGIPDAEDDLVSKSSYQQQGRKEESKDRKESIGREDKLTKETWTNNNQQEELPDEDLEGVSKEDIEEISALQWQSTSFAYGFTHVHKLILESQLKVGEKNVITALSHFDSSHKLVESYIWKVQLEGRHKCKEEASSISDLHVLKTTVEAMKNNYLNLLSDRDHVLDLGVIYSIALRGKEEEIDQLISELLKVRETLKFFQVALLMEENQIEELSRELSLIHALPTKSENLWEEHCVDRSPLHSTSAQSENLPLATSLDRQHIHEVNEEEEPHDDTLASDTSSSINTEDLQDDFKEGIEEDIKILSLDSSNFTSHSHEFAAYGLEEVDDIHIVIVDNPFSEMSADLILDIRLFELDDEEALDLDDTNDMRSSILEYDCEVEHTLGGPATQELSLMGMDDIYFY